MGRPSIAPRAPSQALSFRTGGIHRAPRFPAPQARVGGLANSVRAPAFDRTRPSALCFSLSRAAPGAGGLTSMRPHRGDPHPSGHHPALATASRARTGARA
ncbi:hypothetical protein ASNO1_39410 [Corallococcus caeni]|uniref:Uncharacterized protein n=1 Tax=Corallococcus caeni TaxID=3082388 RepID=A0ABQ6QUI0_9BACT|nr:hypothetical protein ASNO1_39410 [Corallococcus sp. NO1]